MPRRVVLVLVVHGQERFPQTGRGLVDLGGVLAARGLIGEPRDLVDGGVDTVLTSLHHLGCVLLHVGAGPVPAVRHHATWETAGVLGFSGRVVAVVGPTAAGKTALSVALCQQIGGEVVNGDAVQLFRGMDIGSAKAEPSQRGGVPHHLLDVLDVTEEANVAVFQRSARATIDEIGSRGGVPVLVGGSALYVRAVLDRLDFPGTDPQVRARWSEELERRGAEALHAVLREQDPDAAAQILPTNGRRIVRALEVNELTGRPFTAAMPGYRSIYGNLVMIGLDVPRDVLDARIDERVDQMWADGLVEEVRALREQGLERSLTASRALGYQQILAMLRGEIDENEAIAQTKAGTRRFARRQERLFRKDPRITWLAFDDPALVERAVALVASA